jgi:hypothetical protein
MAGRELNELDLLMEPAVEVLRYLSRKPDAEAHKFLTIVLRRRDVRAELVRLWRAADPKGLRRALADAGATDVEVGDDGSIEWK